MDFLTKMERKYGKYAIPNLSIYVVFACVIGYFIQMVKPELFTYLYLDPYAVLHGQIWRLFTWIFMTPSTFDLMTAVSLFCMYSLGTGLERMWGSFRYNLFILSGFLFTILGAFVIYFINPAVLHFGLVTITSYYMITGILLAIAASLPDVPILLYFVIPIKATWIGYLEAFLFILNFINATLYYRIFMIFSIMNFIIYFIYSRVAMKRRPSHSRTKIRYDFMRAKAEHEKRQQQAETTRTRNNVITRHKCAVCGRTELDDPTLEFRFCSKCEGNYEYCMEHIYTHEHVK